MVVAADSQKLKGTLVLSAADKTSATQNKAELSLTLTNKVQAVVNNAKSKVQVNDIRELSDGTLALDYECTGTSDQSAAKKTLSQIVKQDNDVQKTLNKCSKSTPAPKQQSAGTKAPSKPSQIDCDKDHKVTVKDDKTLTGTITVKNCHGTRFARKPSRCTNVGTKFSTLINTRVAKLGIKDVFNLNIVKSTGDKTQTTFQYTLPCQKAKQTQVITSLKDACKDKELVDTCTRENQPDADDSSSESDEKQTPAKPQQTPAVKQTATKAPSKPAQIDCDKDHKVTVKDDNTLTGTLTVKSCHGTRFVRKPSRCTNVGTKFSSLVNTRCNKLGLKDVFNVSIKASGDKTQTVFQYTLPCQKAKQQQVITSLKDACKDKELVDTCTRENQPDADDSSSESDEKQTPAKPQQTPAVKQTATKAPSKPAQIDCDKDHKVTVKDDNTLTGTLTVKSCHGTRFVRKPSRCTNVGTKFSSLVNTRCNKLGLKDVFNVSIKASGDKTQTVFQYTLPCQKAKQQQVITSLKDACKDKELVDTCTRENQPDADDSSSESSEEKSTAKPQQTPAVKPAATKAPSKPAQIDCDKDHKVTVKDDNTLTGTLTVKSCHGTRFVRKPSRCTNVGSKFSSLVNTRCNKLGLKDVFNVSIKASGDKTQTVFQYTLPCQKAKQQQVITSLKDACKDKELVDTCTRENQPDADDSSSESSEEKSTAKPQQTPAVKPAATKAPSKPAQIDCDKDHKVTVKDDNTLTGTLTVKSCHGTRFVRKPSRCTNVGSKFSSLVNTRCNKLGLKDVFNVSIKASGDKTQTVFQYTLPCQKAKQQQVITSLKDACKDKELVDTCTRENQPDADDSSSESSEEKSTGKPQQTPATAATKQTPTTAATKTTGKTSSTKKAPATARNVEVKGCDDDNNIEEKDETLTGKLIVKDCDCLKRFNNKTRLAQVAATVQKQLVAYFQQLRNTKDTLTVTVEVTGGNKTHTFFTYVVKVPKAQQSDAKKAMRQTCKDPQVSFV